MLKVMTILGTRPEIIRLSRVMPALDKHTDHIIVHTGQNYDYELSEVFFKELGLRLPDIVLETNPESLGSMLGTTLIQAEEVLKRYRPGAVLILGDTNSSIAAIMAKRMKIPVFHMEAGNRSFDANVPEEVNRRITDHISDFNLVYTEHARRHLLSEGLPSRRIYLTGSPMREVLDYYRPEINASCIVEESGLQTKNYFLVSLHREENVDSKLDLELLLEGLTRLHQEFGLPLIVSTHPRTRNRLENLGRDYEQSGINFAKPFGFLDYNQLQSKAFCVLSDSGTITEESSLLGFPAVTVRRSMERPEGLDTGSIVLTGLDPDVIVEAVRLVTETISDEYQPSVPEGYEIDDVSQRVVRLILGTARLSHSWDSVRIHDYV